MAARLGNTNMEINFYDFNEYLTNSLRNKSIYEEFKLSIRIDNKELPILSNTYKVIYGNIENLINSIELILNNQKEIIQFDFIEPLLSIKISKPSKIDNNVIFRLSINSYLWTERLDNSKIDICLDININELESFKKELILEWKKRKKTIC